ncbi:MAG: hypothetical protein ABIE94_04935 [archaeon]
MRTKRGMAIETFGRLVIFLIIAVVLLSMWVWIQAIMNSPTDTGIERTVCRQSVLTQASTRGTGGNWLQMINRRQSLFDIDCARYLIEFQDEQVSVRFADEEQKYPILHNGEVVKDFDALTENMVYYVISNEIRLCWYQFHEGKLDIFNKALFDWMGNEKVCFVCDEISFDHQSFGLDTKYEGFWEYIQTTKNPKIEMTLYDYLTDDDHICASIYRGDPNCFEGYAEGGRGLQLHGDDGQIFFIVRAPVELDVKFETGKRYVIFLARQGLDDPEVSTIFSYVLDADKLHEQCDQFIA